MTLMIYFLSTLENESVYMSDAEKHFLYTLHGKPHAAASVFIVNIQSVHNFAKVTFP